ncbi:MFS transporter [Cumulibacter manganitolerans]|uniref:MFS transporter n=1 Tax=Cumulibacter manganitolerans TaxID=1884992 RepID=UPI001296CF8A|nr:MFS transporter [Cumulibacter manganitolerans]
MTRVGSEPRAGRAWLVPGAAMFAIGWGGNQFTPLLAPYRERYGYSQVDVDVFLGAYVVGLVPGLLIAAAWSDARGRHPVLLAGLLSGMLGSLLLAFGGPLGYAGIFAGRALSGIAVGIAMAVGTAWVVELSPGSSGAARSTIALTGGLAMGPAAGGLLAQFAQPPLVWPYVVHLLVCLPALARLLTGRYAETRVARDGPLRLRHRLRVPAARHRRFLRVVLPMAPWIFGSAGIAYAIVPQQVQGALGSAALLFTAGLTVATLGTGVLVQPIARRLDDASTARAVVVSMVLMAIGVALAALTAVAHSPWLAVPVALTLGAAYGIAVVSGLLEIQRMAEPDQIAGLTGVYYAIAYVGFLLPAVLAALSSRFGYPAMLGVLALVAVGCAAICASGWSRHLPEAVRPS